jgi:hypothetical protein
MKLSDVTIPKHTITHMGGPNTYAEAIGLTLWYQLNYRIRLYRKWLRKFPTDPQAWAFKIALRKAYARRRYYKRLYGKNRELWGR